MVGPSEASTVPLFVHEVKDKGSYKVLQTLHNQKRRTILLYDEWKASAVSSEDYVRVILTNQDGSYVSASSLSYKPLRITNKENIIIIHPDTLVSSTQVAESFLCLRRTVLLGRVPKDSLINSTVNDAAIYGSMIHDLFQKVLALDSNRRRRQPTQGSRVVIEEMIEAVEDVLGDHHEKLYCASICDRYARRVLHKVIPEILQWYNDFMGAGNPSAAVGVDINNSNYVVSDVLDIEELIWSPVFGLKGKIDATVKLRRDNRDAGVGFLELKSGKSVVASRTRDTAQAILYNLMLSDRYDRHIVNGLLSYVKYQKALRAVQLEDEESHSEVERAELAQTQMTNDGSKHISVSPFRSELVDLIMQRNKLAGFLRLSASIEDLPPPIEGHHTICAKCYANDSCLVQYKLLENGTEKSAENGPGTELFTQRVAQLTSTHASYYRFWREALAEEERHSSTFRNEIWAMRGVRRESEKRCLANLILVPGTTNGAVHTDDVLTQGEQLLAEFQRHRRSTLYGDFTKKCGISTGDFVVISAESVFSEVGSARGRPSSTETWQSGLTNGFVHHVSPTSVSVVVDRSLASWAKHQGIDVENIFWRVDAEQIYASHSTAKRSLESLFISDETGNIDRLRALIVDKREPEFNVARLLSASRTMLVQNLLHKHNLSLNEEQKKALQMSLSAKDYVLVHGSPGTGKTTTLAAVILASALDGKSVLFCSYSNEAVDNMLCKLLDLDFTDLIRLGRKQKVNQRIHPYHISMQCTPGMTTNQLEKAIEEPRVVATTCHGITHPIFARRGRFDIVVVDEASRIFQPFCLGPVVFSRGPFVLAGDEHQLGPSKRARKNSGTASVSYVEESLFTRLSSVDSVAEVTLRKQYRMAGEVMGLSNELIYGGTLRCGTDHVAAQMLDLSVYGLRSTSPWLEGVRNPLQRLIFLNMDPQEHAVAGPVEEVHQNDTTRAHQNYQSNQQSAREARTIVAACKVLLEGGMKSEDISILSPFRAQVHMIKEHLTDPPEHLAVDKLEDVGVFTINKFQTQENKCVIISFVRSNNQPVGPLLTAPRLLNVAFTRANQKLILVGSANTLVRGSNVLKGMVEYVGRRNLIYPVQLE